MGFEEGFLNQIAKNKTVRDAAIGISLGVTALGASKVEAKNADSLRKPENSYMKESVKKQEKLGGWLNDKVEEMTSDAENIQNKEEAEKFLKANVYPIIAEFYIPQEAGKIEEGPYGVEIRNYEKENLGLIEYNMKEVKKIAFDVIYKFDLGDEKIDSLSKIFQDIAKKTRNIEAGKDAKHKQEEKNSDEFSHHKKSKNHFENPAKNDSTMDTLAHSIGEVARAYRKSKELPPKPMNGKLPHKNNQNQPPFSR